MDNTYTFEFSRLPENLEQLKNLKEAGLTTAQETGALTVLALCVYDTDPDTAIEMLDFLRGPRPLSNYEKQFLKDRLSGKNYLPMSYFEGSSPQNNYTPSKPYTINVKANNYSYDFESEGHITLYIQSSGADSPRPIKFRYKPSTNQWFLWEEMLLSDIRKPAELDPWA
ncbi:DUF6935 domain-containing protein [Microaceticoccus formicicus]|uniref:DUF6935 domain-containing protein n=1 Tax=Microaceticoccus formicicus TaxID=3118105 RepID=UPI003CD036D7|nr:hypothetical protein VZL98_11460 [Peptoniphilaceae bacterium AMB_02]